jgi:hypothetical protein
MIPRPFRAKHQIKWFLGLKPWAEGHSPFGAQTSSTSIPGDHQKGSRLYKNKRQKKLVFRQTTKRLEAFGKMGADFLTCAIGRGACSFLHK